MVKNPDEAGDLLVFAEDPTPEDRKGDIDHGQYVNKLSIPTADTPNADTLSLPQLEPLQPMHDHNPDADAFPPV